MTCTRHGIFLNHPSKMDDRVHILERLSQKDNFYHYTDMLYSIAKSFLATFHDPDRFIDLKVIDIYIMGGMLYFYLYHEAKCAGLIQSDVNMVILSNFLKYKTIDLDMAGRLSSDKDDFSMVHSIQQIQDAFVSSMKQLDPHIFNHLHTILNNKAMVTTSPMVGPYFYLNTEVKLDHGLIEFKPQCSIMVGSHADHVFECLLALNMDQPYTTHYRLQRCGKEFLGESIVASICDQLLPKERVWNLVSFDDTKEHIFASLNRLIKQNPLLGLKMKQGYWRSWMMMYIFEKAMLDPSALNVLESMLCSNTCLARKSFYMTNSKRARLLFSLEIRQKAREIYQQTRDKAANTMAKAQTILIFLKLILTMFENCILPYVIGF